MTHDSRRVGKWHFPIVLISKELHPNPGSWAWVGEVWASKSWQSFRLLQRRERTWTVISSLWIDLQIEIQSSCCGAWWSGFFFASTEEMLANSHIYSTEILVQFPVRLFLGNLQHVHHHVDRCFSWIRGLCFICHTLSLEMHDWQLLQFVQFSSSMFWSLQNVKPHDHRPCRLPKTLFMQSRGEWAHSSTCPSS